MSIYLDGVEVDNPVSFIVVQGEDVDLEFNFSELLTDVVPDLTGAQLVVTYAKEYRQAILGTLTEVTNEPETAHWVRRLTGTETDALSLRKDGRLTSYVMQCKITYDGGVVHIPVYGYFKIVPRVGA